MRKPAPASTGDIHGIAEGAVVVPANPSRDKSAGPLQQPKQALPAVTSAAPMLMIFSFTGSPPVLSRHLKARDRQQRRLPAGPRFLNLPDHIRKEALPSLDAARD